VVLVDREADVDAKLDDTIAKLALAVVKILAVDSRLVSRTLLLPDCRAKLAEAFSKVVTLVLNDPEAVVRDEAVASKLVNLTLLLPDCNANDALAFSSVVTLVLSDPDAEE
jgi:hypothetical protein